MVVLPAHGEDVMNQGLLVTSVLSTSPLTAEQYALACYLLAFKSSRKAMECLKFTRIAIKTQPIGWSEPLSGSGWLSPLESHGSEGPQSSRCSEVMQSFGFSVFFLLLQP